MESVRNILIQLDCDPQCSSFDAVVAIDGGADIILPYRDVRPEQVAALVHGAMFTRSTRKLKHTAIFVGGSDAEAAEANFQAVRETFFGPVQVSVAMDANGCNTTSVAALAKAVAGLSRLGIPLNPDGRLDADPGHSDAGFADRQAIVLGATGAVGQRVVHLLAAAGFSVLVNSRSHANAQRVIDRVQQQQASAQLSPAVFDSPAPLIDALRGSRLIINAGAAGVPYLKEGQHEAVHQTPGVLVDLNAVPPAGLFGVNATDDGTEVGQRFAYGALAVGNLKMKLHREMIRQCFESNQHHFGLLEIQKLSRTLELGT